MRPADFQENGFCRFESDPAISNWLGAVRPTAEELSQDPELREAWLRAGGTWFAGVNILPNTAKGEFAHSGPLAGAAVEFLRNRYPDFALSWDCAQISVCYPGYPMPDTQESKASFTYRVKRDAAHMDGLHAIGADRRRYWREFHGFILGLALSHADATAAPLVVWRGSHEIMRDMLRDALLGLDPSDWAQVDLTQAYHAARRDIFARCERVVLHARPGEATLLHRFALHGVSPWQEGARADPAGRMIAYFRPSFGWNAQGALDAD